MEHYESSSSPAPTSRSRAGHGQGLQGLRHCHSTPQLPLRTTPPKCKCILGTAVTKSGYVVCLARWKRIKSRTRVTSLLGDAESYSLHLRMTSQFPGHCTEFSSAINRSINSASLNLAIRLIHALHDNFAFG